MMKKIISLIACIACCASAYAATIMESDWDFAHSEELFSYDNGTILFENKTGKAWEKLKYIGSPIVCEDGTRFSFTVAVNTLPFADGMTGSGLFNISLNNAGVGLSIQVDQTFGYQMNLSLWENSGSGMLGERSYLDTASSGIMEFTFESWYQSGRMYMQLTLPDGTSPGTYSCEYDPAGGINPMLISMKADSQDISGMLRVTDFTVTAAPIPEPSVPAVFGIFALSLTAYRRRTA